MAMPVIGFLNSGAEDAFQQSVAAFNQGLNELGYLDGKNVEVKYAWADGNYLNLPNVAAALAAQGVDLIAASGGVTSALAARTAAPKIPIVFVCGFNPADSRIGFDGNATGVNLHNTDLLPERLKLFCDLLGHAGVKILLNPNAYLTQIKIEQGAVPGTDVLEASTDPQLEQRFAQAQKERVAILVGPDSFFTSRRDFIVALEKKYKVPAAYPFREYAEAGGLMSYGPSLTNPYRQLGVYVALLLDQVKIADLPVTQTKSFELVINTRAARTHALAIPPGLLARADKIIN
jgi:putative tryptophan/tyrosine transport system substrate-binding protein